MALPAALTGQNVGGSVLGGLLGGAGNTSGAALGELNLTNDPRLVLRDRLDLAGPSRSDGLQGTSFSHRSQRYHVYPFTTYGTSRIEVGLNVHDAEWADQVGIWILGPKQHDGSWAGIRGASGETGSVAIDATGLDEYLVLVGPKSAGDFLPRYPGSEALLEVDTEDGFEEEIARLETRPNQDGEAPTRVLAFEGDFDPEFSLLGGRRFRIEDPLAQIKRAADLPADAFEILFAAECANVECDETTGELLAFAPRTWSRYQLFSPEDAQSLDDTRLGSLNDPQEGFFSIYSASEPHRVEETYQILEGIGADGRTNLVDPLLLRVVPTLHDGAAGQCEVDIIEKSPCRGGAESCRVPTCLGSDAPAPSDLPILTFRSTSLDFDETSLYDLSARCEGNCSPTASPTRYPVYFAHGFNSSKDAWDGISAALIEGDPRWKGWLQAQSVPAFEPVWQRTEHLRRNLSNFLVDLENQGVTPLEGEPFQRINVVAHSMGGLDSRYLLGHPKYNQPSCHLERQCTDAQGNAVPCCSADAEGNAIPWRKRIASVTTLSTPHRGSSFADLSMKLLENRSVDWMFRKAARYVVGLDTEEEQTDLRETLFTLSNQFSRETMTPDFPPPIPERVYTFACASGDEDCAVPDGADLPEEPGRLPAPAEVATIFGWASEACVTGACGSILDPGLALSHAVVKKNEGPGDGVVAIKSAEFGIYMGVRANDHFQWNRLTVAQIVDMAARAFGIKREPVDRFHAHWLGTLAKSGY
ncbi:MAG: esterase/lipase family protein [Myxococcota bacterium]